MVLPKDHLRPSFCFRWHFCYLFQANKILIILCQNAQSLSSFEFLALRGTMGNQHLIPDEFGQVAHASKGTYSYTRKNSASSPYDKMNNPSPDKGLRHCITLDTAPSDFDKKAKVALAMARGEHGPSATLTKEDLKALLAENARLEAHTKKKPDTTD